ncbi:MAG: flagellar basal body P-ring formation chaperone FlgA [Rhizobiaceae bacterium]|jgi:flagella basal body P-ring formation protein FlgA|nr:flagellar basal body P-ring formation protein FlgA [Hyphomicrobiales bacterium]
MKLRRKTVLLRLVGCLAALAAFVQPVRAEDVAVVTRHVVYPGQEVSAGDLQVVTVTNHNRDLRTVATRIEQVDGKLTRLTLLPGHYIPLNAIRDAYTVEQGAAVHVLFSGNGLVITATAVTLEPGSAGDVIKVRNTDSGRIFSGIVMADGTIRVGAS